MTARKKSQNDYQHDSQTKANFPLVYRFPDAQSAPTVEQAFLAFGREKRLLLMHSGAHSDSTNRAPSERLGRYSFLMADPFDWIVAGEADTTSGVLDKVRQRLDKWHTHQVSDLPPMQGGIAGLFSYELNSAFENAPRAKHDAFPIPALVLGLYDCVMAWDHQEQTCVIVSQGFPETDAAKRKQRAEERIAWCLQTLEQAPNQNVSTPTDAPAAPDNSSAQHAVSGPTGLTSNFSKPTYVAAVKRCVEYVYAGDVFQINLAQQLRLPANCTSQELFLRLCQCNPAPFSGYFDFDAPGFAPTQIISASPERLVSVRDRVVETRPIKGTRPRTGQPLVDIQAREDLLSSVKDAAENTMIVDLMRNDLSRVCEDDSVVVPQLCELEEYASVLHLVSSVEGKLREDCDLADLIAAIFPGGSITGAPKVRAMEIIAELEPDVRGAYCGSLGYLGFDGTADLNILIRTVTAQQGWWQIPVGGGIVSQSAPEAEYEETWTKAAGILRAASMRPKDQADE